MDSTCCALGGTDEAGSPSPGGFRPFWLLDVELLFLLAIPLCRLRVLECISLRHACCAKLVTGRLCREEVVYRLFSAVVTQDVTAGVAAAPGLMSKKRNPHGAKLLTTELLGEGRECALGLLRENARLVEV